MPSSVSPPIAKRRRRVASSPKKKKKTGVARKRTHWLVLVKAIYSVNGPTGSAGLTAAMKVGPSHLQAFKDNFAEVPSEEAAIKWFREKIAALPSDESVTKSSL